MFEIVIIHYYKSFVDGVMTSMIDLYHNLKDRFNVKLMIICPELYYLPENDYYNFPLNQTEFTRNGEHIEFEEFDADETNDVTCSIPFLKFNKNFGDPKIFFSVTENKGEQIELGSRVTICSARLLYEKLMGRLNLKFRMGTGNLFILDSLDLYRSKVKDIPSLDIAIPKNLHRLFYFSNPSNFLKGKNNIEYYHKFSKTRLDTLELNDVYNYQRQKEKIKVKGNYYENIGKSIFEHLYHGKEVNYSAKNMTMKDGLYYYLKLFGVDGSKDHFPLNISREEIEDKLFLKDDDEIVKRIHEIGL